MAKGNPFNKYSKTGGLNPLWVERDMEIREEKEKKEYVDYITDITSKSVASIVNAANTNYNKENNKKRNNKNRNNLSLNDELEIKFQFLKRHSDGSETDYQIAKHALGLK